MTENMNKKITGVLGSYYQFSGNKEYLINLLSKLTLEELDEYSTVASKMKPTKKNIEKHGILVSCINKVMSDKFTGMEENAIDSYVDGIVEGVSNKEYKVTSDSLIIIDGDNISPFLSWVKEASKLASVILVYTGDSAKIRYKDYKGIVGRFKKIGLTYPMVIKQSTDMFIYSIITKASMLHPDNIFILSNDKGFDHFSTVTNINIIRVENIDNLKMSENKYIDYTELVYSDFNDMSSIVKGIDDYDKMTSKELSFLEPISEVHVRLRKEAEKVCNLEANISSYKTIINEKDKDLDRFRGEVEELLLKDINSSIEIGKLTKKLENLQIAFDRESTKNINLIDELESKKKDSELIESLKKDVDTLTLANQNLSNKLSKFECRVFQDDLEVLSTKVANEELISKSIKVVSSNINLQSEYFRLTAKLMYKIAKFTYRYNQFNINRDKYSRGSETHWYRGSYNKRCELSEDYISKYTVKEWKEELDKLGITYDYKDLKSDLACKYLLATKYTDEYLFNTNEYKDYVTVLEEVTKFSKTYLNYREDETVDLATEDDSVVDIIIPDPIGELISQSGDIVFDGTLEDDMVPVENMEDLFYDLKDIDSPSIPLLKNAVDSIEDKEDDFVLPTCSNISD